MDLKPDSHDFIFMEETGKDILHKAKELIYKDLWLGRNGITGEGGSMWTGMRNIMKSHRTYS